ncbi:MAG: hypothetical protein R3C28_04880 [Pirellulaceae bacterium]
MFVPYTTIPIVSAALLILVGVLIGHFVWFREVEEGLSEDPGELQADNKRMFEALKASQNAFQELEKRYAKRQTDYETKVAAFASLETQCHQLRSENEAAESEVTQLRHSQQLATQQASQAHKELGVVSEKLQQLETKYNQKEVQAVRLLKELDERKKVDAEHEASSGKLKAEAIRLDGELKTALAKLERETKVRAELETQSQQIRDAHAQAQAELKQRTSELASLRQEQQEKDKRVTQLTEQLAMWQRDRVRKDEVEAAFRTKDAEIQRFSQERDELRKTVAQLQTDTQKLQAEATELRNRHTTIQTEIDGRSQELQTAQQQRDELAAKLKLVESQLQSALDGAQQDAVQSQKWAKDNQTLQTHVVELERKLEDARRQQSRHSTEMVGTHEIARLTAELHSKDRQIKQLEAERQVVANQFASVDGRSKSSDELLQLQAKLETADSEMERLRSENRQLRQRLNDAMLQQQAFEQHRADDRTELAALAENEKRRLHELALEVESLEDRLAETDEQLSAERKQRQSLAAELQDLQKSLDSESASQVQLQQLQTEKTNLETQLQMLKSRLTETSKQRDEAIAAEGATRQIVLELRSELDGRLATLSAVEQRNEEAIADCVTEKQMRMKLEEKLRDNSHKLEQLTERLKQFDRMRARCAELESAMSEKDSQITVLINEKEKAGQRVAEAERNVIALKAKNDSHEQTILQLQSHRPEDDSESPKTERRDYVTLSSFRGLNFGLSRSDNDGEMELDSKLGMVYVVPPERKDDLKKISGIASTLEGKLNELGVYRYKQIMEWDDIAVEAFSSLLTFKDRIERDNWIGQARRLHYEHYGNRAA